MRKTSAPVALEVLFKARQRGSRAINHPGTRTQPQGRVKMKNYLVLWLTAAGCCRNVLPQSNLPVLSFSRRPSAASVRRAGSQERKTNSVLYFPSLKDG